MNYNFMEIISELQGKLYDIDPRLSEVYVSGFELRYSGFSELIYFNGVKIFDPEDSDVYNYEEDRYFTEEEFKDHLILKAIDITCDYLSALRRIGEGKCDA